MKKQFRSFDDARKFARSLSLRSGSEWKKLAINKHLPKDIPHDPAKSYKKEWKGWKYWLGYEEEYRVKSQARNFIMAREFVHSLCLKNQLEWRKYLKSGKKPKDIPSLPARTYHKEWNGYGDWLGTGNIHPKYLEFLPFEEARKFVRTLNLKKLSEWNTYCDSGQKPKNIPRAPAGYYKQNWISWADWFSENAIPIRGKRMVSFEEARNFARSLNLKGKDVWVKFSKSQNRPYYVPVDPSQIYKNKGWKGWNDWLDTEIDPRNINFKSYEDAKKNITTFNVKSQTDWSEFVKTDKKPIDIPANPRQYYKKEWKGWGDFLSTGSIASITKSRNYLNYNESSEEVRKIAKKYNIKTWSDWNEAVKEGKIPKNIPSAPNRVYSKKRKK